MTMVLLACSINLDRCNPFEYAARNHRSAIRGLVHVPDAEGSQEGLDGIHGRN